MASECARAAIGDNSAIGHGPATDTLIVFKLATYHTGMVKVTTLRTLLLLIPFVALAGCESEDVIQPPPPVKTASSPAGSNETEETPEVLASAERKAFDGLAFVIPTSWKETPLSDFQRGIISAKFAMPEAGSESTLTLSRAVGGLQSNLDRWRGQFRQSRPERTETLTVAGKESTLIDLEGEFSPGFGKQANGTWRMIGIIVPLDERAYFMKLTGPVGELAKIEDGFLDFAKSAVAE